MKLSHILKAMWAGAMAALGGLSTILVGNETFGQVTDGQWVAVAFLGLAAVGGVYGLTQYNAMVKANGNGNGKSGGVAGGNAESR